MAMQQKSPWFWMIFPIEMPYLEWMFMDFPMYCHQIVSSFLCLQQDNKAVFPSDFC